MRCSNCFQERSGITSAYPNTPPVCRGCARSLDGAVGWLETHGYGIVELTTGQVLGVSPPTPQSASREVTDGSTEPGEAENRDIMTRGLARKPE